ncbi:hypothetical protein KFK09_004907 [Dendrobium nobile]|uniref:RING-type domain-containing protein n=1 Tax=Dendrobium nobile TaxID=94219 RepID=A0A8T3BXN5_DENNO|nr:hypothetical protein KFK09_004907 [Dendrobium nobile]
MLNPPYSVMFYSIIIFIVILLFMAIIFYITYLVLYYPPISPPLQPEHNDEIGIDNATLRIWPMLTYAEASSQDLRVLDTSCSVCLVNYEEELGENNALRLLPECRHLFHATCVDQWLRWQRTYPVCKSLVVIEAIQTPSTKMIQIQIE